MCAFGMLEFMEYVCIITFTQSRCDLSQLIYFTRHLMLAVCVCVCVCVCVWCVCVLCVHVYVVYEDTNLYNDIGITRRR